MGLEARLATRKREKILEDLDELARRRNDFKRELQESQMDAADGQDGSELTTCHLPSEGFPIMDRKKIQNLVEEMNIIQTLLKKNDDNDPENDIHPATHERMLKRYEKLETELEPLKESQVHDGNGIEIKRRL